MTDHIRELNGCNDMDTDSASLSDAARVLGSARNVLILTGAGMSADSGMPTYRGDGGLYEVGMTEEGLPIEEVLSGRMLVADPTLAWKYINQIEHACRGIEPHEGHRVLARLQNRYEHLWLATQNVDGLHTTAGCEGVIEMHGNLHHLHCLGCGQRVKVTDYSVFESMPPTCEDCGHVIRPDIVLFGEKLPMQAMVHYEMALTSGFDALLTIGTSAVFPYILGPVREASQADVPVIEINPQITDISPFCTTTIRMPALQALMAIEQRLPPAIVRS